MPKLRFPEFQDVREWKEKPLGDIIYKVGEKNKKGIAYPIYSISNKDGFLPQSEQFDGVDSNNRGYDITLYKIVKKNTFAYNPARINVGSIGYSGELNNVIISSLYVCFKSKDEIDDLFLSFYFQTYNFNESVKNNVEGGIRSYLFYNNLTRIDISLPPKIDEQQKIADCLFSLDELIAAQADKLDILKAHKKGLMQKLFPVSGQTTPTLRFPEFQAAGEWIYRKLGGFITERNQSLTEKLPLFSLTIEDGVTPKTERYERAFLVKDEKEAYKIVYPDDFAYNPMNLRFGAIAMHSGAEKVALSKYYNIFYCDDSVDSRFCEIYFKSPGMITHYNNVATGSLIEKRRVHFREFLKFKIRFPSLSEQQKIADCLSSLDELILAQADNLNTLKAHKKGLMQQLFPNPDEVAG